MFVDIVHRDLKLENILLAVDPNNLEDKLYIKVSNPITDSVWEVMGRGTISSWINLCVGNKVFSPCEGNYCGL